MTNTETKREQHQISREERYQMRVKFDFPKYYNLELWRKMDAVEREHDNKACIVYPLYEGLSGIYPEHHVNSACWSAHSFIVNSNLIDLCIPIFFFVEDKIWSKAYRQLIDAGIPNMLIKLYQAPHRLGWGGQWISQSLWMATLKQLQMFDTVIMPDTDLFLSTRISDKKLDFSRLFERQDKTKYASYEILHNRLREPKWDKYYELSVEKGETLFRKLMQQQVGMDITQVHHILAVLNAFSPMELNPQFTEFVKRNVQYIGSEEDLLSVYMQSTGDTIEDLRDTWGLKVANYFDDFNDCMDNFYNANDHFFSHLRPDKLPTDRDTDRFMNAIGLNKNE